MAEGWSRDWARRAGEALRERRMRRRAARREKLSGQASLRGSGRGAEEEGGREDSVSEGWLLCWASARALSARWMISWRLMRCWG